MANDGVEVGRAHIEVSPKLTGIAQFRKDLKAHLQGMAKEADKSLKESQKDMMGRFQKEVDAFQKGKTKSIFEGQRKEIQSQQSLDKQRQSSFDAQQKQFAEQVKNLEYVRKLKEKHFAAEQKEAAKRAADIAKETAEAKKAAQQFIEDQKKKDAYLRARLAGLTQADSAKYATGGFGEINPNATNKELRKLTTNSRVAGVTAAKAFDQAAHSMSQLSTRIGLGSFQLQLLGGFATTFLTGPAAYAFGSLAREGLKFAVSIDYARASMKSLLGPSTDVEKVLADIRKMAIESPLFNTEDAISYAQKLAAVGVKGKDLYKSMQALSNIFLTQGVAGPERASLALMAYTQILSKGTIGMDDLRQQFAEHVPGGIQIFQEVARRMGFKTLDGLREAMKEGSVTAAELNEEFIKLGTSQKYVAGAAEASKTLGGVWQAFQEDVQATIGMGFDRNRKEIIAAIEGIKPVVMDLIDSLVQALPSLINWLGRLVVKAQELKKSYDSLSPQGQETIRQIIMIGLVSGPAAIALGIFGTALSGVANAAALGLKALSMMGGAVAGAGGWIIAIAVAIAALSAAIAYLYVRSESVRKAVLQVLNVIKDFIANAFLPTVDRLIGAVQSLGDTFGFLGLESKDLAWVLSILLVPLGIAIYNMYLLVGAIKAVQAVMLVLGSILYAIAQILAMQIWLFQQLYQMLSHIPGPIGDFFEGVAEKAEKLQKGLKDLIDVTGLWKGLTKTNSKATEEWQGKLNNLDFTTTGLVGAFGTWNGLVDQSIQKQMTLEQAIDNARRAMQSQANAAASATDASDAYNQSMLSLKESIKANGRTLDDHSRKGLANRTALKAAAQASYEMMLQDIRSGVPMEEAIRRHQNRTKALKEEFGKNKETQAAAQKLIDTYGKVPKDVKTLLKLMGYTDLAGKMQQILAAQKVANNPKIPFSKALAAERKAWQIEKGEGLKNDGLGKKHGGLIRGPGGPTGDKIPIMASDLEYMIRASAVKKLGKPALDYINQTGQLPVQQFANGGQVTWPMNVDVSGTKFPGELGGGANTGGLGWVRMMQILRSAFPGLPMISGYRPGAVTSTGNRSYHALGRAVDIPPRWDVFNWIREHYGRGTKELIFTPAGGRQIKNGMPHVFSGGTIQEDHYNHIHWAYDNGGLVPPDTPFINKTSASELMLNSAQSKALEEKIRNSGQPVNVTVYVDGVKRDAEIVFDEKAEQLIQALGGV